MDVNWNILIFFSIYAGFGIVVLILWWVVYDAILSQGYNLKEAIFGPNPNPAVAVDMLGGILAMGIMLYSIVALAERSSFRLNFLAVAVNILVLLVLLAVLRLFVAAFLRVWFRDSRDAQGDIITFNNELFKQRNIATGIFSTVTYIILVSGLVEWDLFDQGDKGLATVWNMVGVWVLGFALVMIHSFFYLEYGTKNHILHEAFHDNNPAAPFSLLGLVAGILPLNHQFISSNVYLISSERIPGAGDHMFNSPGLWLSLGVVVLFVLVARGILQIVVLAVLKINLRSELVVRDNLAWGLLDGGLIFSLVLIFNGLMV